MTILPPGTVTSMPRCIGCGFTVAEHGQVCEACADKPQFSGKPTAPKAFIETAPQKEPPYIRQGNFARPQPAVDEDTL